ncbi:MAG: glycine--tRNA ligase subunit beta [Deltaproteobacteria bacterium]|nr:glycine--tRNA ligase subunit beta [Deltaproteobacteria bacterium]
MAGALNLVLYQKGLGNYDKKSLRIRRLSEFIGIRLGLSETELNDIRIASEISKADLLSQSVGEFPELQGIMGKYFALHSGLPERIAIAIEEHYRPTQSGGQLPQSIIGQVIAIADKTDHLTGLFLTNQKPSASSDPYGARRAASGVVDIIRYSGMKNLPLSELVSESLKGFNIDEIRANDNKVSINPRAGEEILEFIRVRIKAMLTEEIKPDVAEAILNAEPGIDDVSSVFERKEALMQYIRDPDFEKFAVVYKRASNITKDFSVADVDKSLFEYEEENVLYESVARIRSEYFSCLTKRDFFNAMRLLRENLYEPVFRFFDKVFVMAEDEKVRKNRLALLKSVVVLFRKIIDLSFISSM